MAANYKHLSANGNNLCAKQGARLKSVVINGKGAASNVLTLYDNAAGDTSGNVIAVIDTVNIVQPTLNYDVLTQTGLSATLATGTAADVTVCWE
jgi:hypothetical protein